ncbi:MAG: rhomboid family intramembrane serine protease [Myxococcota bacterium]
MSTPSRSDLVTLDLDAPIPGTWGLVTALCVVHLASLGWAGGRLGLVDALVLGRPDWLRVALGGQTATLVEGGQVWRLATSVWIHADLLHLSLNALAILALGRILEPWLGAGRLLGAFAIGGVMASLASHAVGVPRSDGASGGAFALLGVAVVLGIRWRRRLDARDARLLGPVLWGLTLANVVLGFVVPRIDAIAHVGGLGVGIALGILLGIPGDRHVATFAAAAFATVSAWGWSIG